VVVVPGVMAGYNRIPQSSCSRSDDAHLTSQRVCWKALQHSRNDTAERQRPRRCDKTWCTSWGPHVITVLFKNSSSVL
jgi:hypothetical protein